MAEPYGYLCNLLSKRGRTDLTGVHMTSVSVNVDPNEDYGYDLDYVSLREKALNELQSWDWREALVKLRLKDCEHGFVRLLTDDHDGLIQIFNEAGQFYAQVYLLEAEVSSFFEDIAYFQIVLKEVARFVGKVPTSLRITIGWTHLNWQSVIDQGDAQEITVGF
jgi:hypothetical protein